MIMGRRKILMPFPQRTPARAVGYLLRQRSVPRQPLRAARARWRLRGADGWYVQRLRSQPNLLAWYINDELGPEYLDKIEEKNLQIKQLDGDHPTFRVLNKTGSWTHTSTAATFWRPTLTRWGTIAI